MNVDVTQFQQVFFDEAEEHLVEFERLLLTPEALPDETERLNTIFRCAHSLKGGSAMFGFQQLAHFTHSLETLLDRLRNGQAQMDGAITQLLLESLDQLKALLAVARGETTCAPDSESLLFQIEEAIACSGVVEEAWDEDALRAEIAAMLAAQEPPTARQEPTGTAIPKESAILKETALPKESAGACSLRSEPEFRLEVTRVAKPESATRTGAAGGRSDTQTLRVSAEKVDKLINLVGELVISQSMLHEALQDFSTGKLPRLREAAAHIERASRELQERVMAVRMLPIRSAFGRFPRLVHDLATRCGKQIELKTLGEDTELDKAVIEAIADPLTHLVRNCVDHGLETPEERRSAGKPETGLLLLNAFHEGGSIVIEVSDDGRGLNRDRIWRKAVERGLLDEVDPSPSDESLFHFIFHPGFSTAPDITDLSGRGVGMDIVKQAVQQLGGSIALHSTPGQGTRFRIRLPLTLAILDGLSVSVGQEVYILPLTSIVESIRPCPAAVRQIAGREEVVLVRDEAVPMLRLYQRFDIPHPRCTEAGQGLLVIVENEGRKTALLVDALIGQQQAVMKSLETNYGKADGIAGATILGDGRVGLILDVPNLIKQGNT